MQDTTMSRSSAEARQAYLQRLSGNKAPSSASGARSTDNTRFDGKPLSEVEHTAVERFVHFLRSDEGKDKKAVYRPDASNYREDDVKVRSSIEARQSYLERLKSNGRQ